MQAKTMKKNNTAVYYWSSCAQNYVNKVLNFSFAGGFSQKTLGSYNCLWLCSETHMDFRNCRSSPIFLYHVFFSILYLFLQKVFFLPIPLWPAPHLQMKLNNSIRISILLTPLGFQSVTLKIDLDVTVKNTTLVLLFPLKGDDIWFLCIQMWIFLCIHKPAWADGWLTHAQLLFCMAIHQDWCKAVSDVPTQMWQISMIFRDWNLFNIISQVIIILAYT